MRFYGPYVGLVTMEGSRWSDWDYDNLGRAFDAGDAPWYKCPGCGFKLNGAELMVAHMRGCPNLPDHCHPELPDDASVERIRWHCISCGGDKLGRLKAVTGEE